MRYQILIAENLDLKMPQDSSKKTASTDAIISMVKVIKETQLSKVLIINYVASPGIDGNIGHNANQSNLLLTNAPYISASPVTISRMTLVVIETFRDSTIFVQGGKEGAIMPSSIMCFDLAPACSTHANALGSVEEGSLNFEMVRSFLLCMLLLTLAHPYRKMSMSCPKLSLS